jgi:hypothetical protein
MSPNHMYTLAVLAFLPTPTSWATTIVVVATTDRIVIASDSKQTQNAERGA